MKDCANARRKRLPQMPAANTQRKYISRGFGLTRGTTLQRRGHLICGGDKKKITDYAD